MLSSCYLFNSNHSFIDVEKLEKQQGKWNETNLKNYSFDFGMVFVIPGYDYSFSITVENGLLVSKKYINLGRIDVSELTDSEIEEIIQNIKDNLGDEYDTSYDKLCIELSNMEDVFNLIKFVYEDKLSGYNNYKNKIFYDFSSQIEYDDKNNFPYYFSCRSKTCDLPATVSGTTGVIINIDNFVCD